MLVLQGSKATRFYPQIMEISIAFGEETMKVELMLIATVFICYAHLACLLLLSNIVPQALLLYGYWQNPELRESII